MSVRDVLPKDPVWEIPEHLRLELLAQLSLAPGRPGMTYAEFLEWADEDTLAERVDGQVVVTSAATLCHQELVRFLGEVVGTYFSVHGLGVI
jgi:hypothetical protein